MNDVIDVALVESEATFRCFECHELGWLQDAVRGRCLICGRRLCLCRDCDRYDNERGYNDLACDDDGLSHFRVRLVAGATPPGGRGQ